MRGPLSPDRPGPEERDRPEAAEEAPLSEEEAALAAIPADIIVEISRDRMQATVRFDTRKGKGLLSVIYRRRWRPRR